MVILLHDHHVPSKVTTRPRTPSTLGPLGPLQLHPSPLGKHHPHLLGLGDPDIPDGGGKWSNSDRETQKNMMKVSASGSSGGFFPATSKRLQIDVSTTGFDQFNCLFLRLMTPAEATVHQLSHQAVSGKKRHPVMRLGWTLKIHDVFMITLW